MKRAITQWLRKRPRLFGLVRGVLRRFAPSLVRSPLQKTILESLGRNRSVFFVQVGANDGILDQGWRGLFIEPVGFLFERLKKNYGDTGRFIFENTAIAPAAGEIEFYYVSEKAKLELGDALPYWYDQLGSFDKSHILQYFDGALEPYIVSQKIAAAPLRDILERHRVSSVDILHIDTEGYDYKVLSTLDFSSHKPTVVLYEHKHLSPDEKAAAESLLVAQGYRCSTHDGDTLAIRERKPS
jgi:FkbM family methyltransferase